MFSKNTKIQIYFILNVISCVIAKPTSDLLNSTESNDENTSDNEIPDAYSKEREDYSKKMRSYMNESIDPCDDFYEYACGNWPNVIKEHNGEHKRGNLLDILFNLNDIAGELLEKTSKELSIDDYEREWNLTRVFYQSCLNADLMPMRRSQAYLDIIQSISGFPAIDSKAWNSSNFYWFNASAKYSIYGVNTFVNERIIPQYPFYPYYKMPEFGFDQIVHIDNIDSISSHGYQINRKRMVDYLTTYNVDSETIEEVVEDIFIFLNDIVNITDQYDSIHKCEDINEVLDVKFVEFSYYNDIAWSGKDFKVFDLGCPCNYLYRQFHNVCNEHKEAVANYMALKFLYHMDARLNDKKFQKEYCILTTHRTMPYLIDNIFLKKYFNEQIKEEISTIVKEVRKSLHYVLEQEADWLDESTRKEALLKESTVDIRIGYLSDPVLKNRLIHEMNNLTFVNDNFEENNIKAKKFKKFINRYMGLHYEEFDNSSKPMELLQAMQVNAFYYNIDNSINVMAGILMPPVYQKSWPNSLKYGTIGYLIGHEFTHGFDSIGGLFDSEGKERVWWSKKSENVFNERANCYVNHFNQYKIAEINRTINGNETKDENIADSGGLRQALNAYRQYMKDQTKEIGHKLLQTNEQMPNLNLSPDQIFFLGFAQLWCASLKEEHYWELITNEHSIDKYRVLGTVTNHEEFAKAYNCPVGSKMNPRVDKCRVW